MTRAGDVETGEFEPVPGGAIPALNAGDVHLWRLDARTTARCGAYARAVLDRGEAERADRLRGAAASTFAVTRGALRLALAHYLDAAPDALRFTYGPTGKPQLPAAQAAGIVFSVTHTTSLSLIAVAALQRVGVDAEWLQPRQRAVEVARRVFAPATCRLLERLAGDERVLAFYHAWTLREAHVKALGTGVFSSSDTLPLDWPPAGAPHRRRAIDDDGMHRSWTIHTLQPAAGCIATLVAEGSAAPPRMLDAAVLLEPR